mgnify:CR=1 FL=1
MVFKIMIRIGAKSGVPSYFARAKEWVKLCAECIAEGGLAELNKDIHYGNN